jgi:transcriptional regulator with XRE-family HTH domain
MIDVLKATRKAAGLSQRKLSGKFKRSHNYVSIIEKGERIPDGCELIEWFEVVGADPAEMVDQIVKLRGPRRKRR